MGEEQRNLKERILKEQAIDSFWFTFFKLY
jgi:hypothetical protein